MGFSAFRWEFVDHEVPARLIGPDGRQYRQLSRAASKVLEEAGPEAGKRWLASFRWTLDTTYATMPDVADRYEAGLVEARSAQDRLFKDLQVKSKDATPRDGSVWLKPRAAIWRKVSDAVIAMGKITSWLADELYGGEDPSLVDLCASRLRPGAVTKLRTDGRFRSDVDRRFRLGADPTAAPRFDDPRFYDRWLEGLAKVRGPEVFERLADIGRYGGGRAFQALSLTVFDALVRHDEAIISAPNKGSAGERTMEFILLEQRWEALLRWIDGARRRLTGLSLARLLRMVRNPDEVERTKSMPLFTEDGINPIKYDRLYRVFRRAAEAADLYVDDDEYRDTGQKRFVTFHYLRHEYVHSRLDHADDMEPLARNLERKAIISYMRWRNGGAMLEWYSAHHSLKLARTAAVGYNRRIDEALKGASVPVGVMSRLAGPTVRERLAGLR